MWKLNFTQGQDLLSTFGYKDSSVSYFLFKSSRLHRSQCEYVINIHLQKQWLTCADLLSSASCDNGSCLPGHTQFTCLILHAILVQQLPHATSSICLSTYCCVFVTNTDSTWAFKTSCTIELFKVFTIELFNFVLQNYLRFYYRTTFKVLL